MTRRERLSMIGCYLCLLIIAAEIAFMAFPHNYSIEWGE